MHEILLSNSVLVFLLSESILFALLSIAFILSAKILYHWDFESFTPLQFRLEKQSYLVSSIILLVFGIKFVLTLYFIYSLDILSSIVTGAMCGAGVLDANDYGRPLLLLKLLILFLLTLWISIHHYDMKSKTLAYFKDKSWLFLLIFLFLSIEIFLDFSYFSSIEPNIPVSCCSALFGQLEGANPLPFGLSLPLLLILFYLLFILMLLVQEEKYAKLNIIITLLFAFISYYSMVYFFGTYIYQIPTHKCPFCMLQKEYYFIGYLLWGSLLIATYISLTQSITSLYFNLSNPKRYTQIRLLLSFFVLLCTSYVVVYFYKNGVLL